MSKNEIITNCHSAYFKWTVMKIYDEKNNIGVLISNDTVGRYSPGHNLSCTKGKCLKHGLYG
jgi:hypothetical protein